MDTVNHLGYTGCEHYGKRAVPVANERASLVFAFESHFSKKEFHAG
jgi:hypothetical protein